MDKRKISKKIFRYVVSICFATFMALYLSQSTGYIEYENQKQVRMTKKQIEKFEKDVAEGKQINMQKYLKTTKKDYQNKLSKTGLTISKAAGSTIESAISHTFKVLSKLGN